VAKQPLLTGKLKLFMLAMVLANTGGQMYGSLLPLYLTALNADVVQVGLFFTLSRIFPLILQILGGWLSDSLGRLRSIALGSLAGVLSYVGLILAPTWQWVLIGEGLGAVTRSLIGPSFPAFIAEESSGESRARAFAVTQFLFNIVMVIGPPLGGWLKDIHGFKTMLICAGSIYTLAAMIRVGMARAAAQGSEIGAKRLSLGGLRGDLGAILALTLAGGVFTWILITDGIYDISLSLSLTLEPLYLGEIGRLNGRQIGLLYAIFGIFNMAANVPAGWLSDKKGERITIALGFVLQFVGTMVFLRAGNFWGFAAAWTLFGVAVGMIEPAHQSLTSKVVPQHLRGTAFGLLRSSLGVFSLPAPAIGAQLWKLVSPRFPFQVTAGAVLASVVPVWLKFKLPDAVPASEEEQPEA
jgi:MFS family permease